MTAANPAVHNPDTIKLMSDNTEPDMTNPIPDPLLARATKKPATPSSNPNPLTTTPTTGTRTTENEKIPTIKEEIPRLLVAWVASFTTILCLDRGTSETVIPKEDPCCACELIEGGVYTT